MGAGDATQFGPYGANITDVTTAAAALGAAYVSANDTYMIIPAANGKQWYAIHIEAV